VVRYISRQHTGKWSPVSLLIWLSKVIDMHVAITTEADVWY